MNCNHTLRHSVVSAPVIVGKVGWSYVLMGPYVERCARCKRVVLSWTPVPPMTEKAPEEATSGPTHPLRSAGQAN